MEKSLIKTKTIFFGLYATQQVMRSNTWGNHESSIVVNTKNASSEDFFLELRNISQMTDEEFTTLFKRNNTDLKDLVIKKISRDERYIWVDFKWIPDNVKPEQIGTSDGYWHSAFALHFFDNTKFEQSTIDYLRSIGILIPFLYLSEKELIDHGFVKIKK